MKIIDELHERHFYPHHAADTPDDDASLVAAGHLRVVHNPFFSDVYARVIANYSFGSWRNGTTRAEFAELTAAMQAAFDYAETLPKEGVQQ
jgi:hypothetical protein